MNVGPTIGVAVATTLMSVAGVGLGPALTVLAALTAIGALSALRLPGPDAAPIPPTRRPSDDAAEARTRR